MDRGAWYATDHGVAKSRTRLSDFTHSLTSYCKGPHRYGTFPSSQRIPLSGRQEADLLYLLTSVKLGRFRTGNGVCGGWAVSLRWPSLLSGEGYGLREGVTFSLAHISQHRRPCTQGPGSRRHVGSIWG